MGEKRLRRWCDPSERLEPGVALGSRRTFDAQLSREDEPRIGPSTSPCMWGLCAMPFEESPPIVGVVTVGPPGF